MSTFGKTTIGGQTGTASANYELMSGPFTLTEDGTVSAVVAYIDTFGADQAFTPIIRPDDGGNPHATTHYVGSEVTSLNADSPHWLSMPLAQALSAGAYWLGILCDAGGSNYAHDAEAELQYATITYPTPNSNFSGTPVNEKASIYAVYTPTGGGGPGPGEGDPGPEGNWATRVKGVIDAMDAPTAYDARQALREFEEIDIIAAIVAIIKEP